LFLRAARKKKVEPAKTEEKKPAEAEQKDFRAVLAKKK